MTRQEPVYRGIVGIDIERYSRAEWTDPIRARLRGRLHRLVDESLAQAAIDAALARRSDTGDGMWLLVASQVSTARLLHPFLTGLVDRLVEDNRQAPAAEHMRLRLVVHAGEVLPDAHGETGASRVHAARLLDAEAIRLVLSANVAAAAVLVTSDAVHDGVVRHGYEGIDPSAWQRIEIHVKETSAPAWVHLPGLAEQPVLPEQQLLRSLPGDTLPVRRSRRHQFVWVTAALLAPMLAAAIGAFVHREASSPSATPTANAPAPPPCSRLKPCTYQVGVGGSLCLDQDVRRAIVQVWTCDATLTNQQWVEDHYGKQFTLRSARNGKCVVGDESGSQLAMGSCDGNAARWTATYHSNDASYTFYNVAHPQLCLTDKGGATSLHTPVVLAPCADSPEQRWS